MRGDGIERWFLRTLLAIARRDANAQAIAELVPRLGTIEGAQAPRDGRESRLQRIAWRLRLEDVELDFLSAAIAYACDPRLPVHAEALGGPQARRGLSIAAYCDLVAAPPEVGTRLASRLDDHHPLLANGLLLSVDPLASPVGRPYQVPPRVLGHLEGHDVPDHRVTLVAPDPAWVFHLSCAESLAAIARSLDDPAGVVIIEGAHGAGRRSAIAHVSDRAVAAIEGGRLDARTIEAALHALRREAVLLDAVPVIADADLLPVEALRLVPELIERFPMALALTSARRGFDLGVDRPVVRVGWSLPPVDTCQRLWSQAVERLGRQTTGDLEHLAIQYRVGPGEITRAAATAAKLHEDGDLDARALIAGLRHNIGERMTGLAERIEVAQSWSDVVLAEDVREQVQTLVARVRHMHHVLDRWGFRSKMARGAGVAAMFSGPPGTGKTMVSGVIARELGLELYQVDLSQIVSKWIGETEKQLAKVFDAAEAGHVLLLFDEADALFGQRSTEVRGATDRYANLEVNFLLQRIEAFSGITILTTNLDASIDRALKRRLAAHIVFATPDEDERAQLWSRMTTGSAPFETGIPFDELARVFPSMTGANIRNAVSSAAFMAAAENASKITYNHLIRAGRAEYRSMGHVLAERTMGIPAPPRAK